MIRLIFLTIIFIHSLAQSQTLDPRYPNLLSGRSRIFFIGAEQGKNLKYKAEVTSESVCCLNSMTEKEMRNFSFTLTIENVSNLTYYVKATTSGLVNPLMDLPNSLGLNQINIRAAKLIIKTDNKTQILNPGATISFQAFTDMKSMDYYPISASEHEQQLSKNPNSFYPNYIDTQMFLKGYSTQEIIEINKTMVNLHGPLNKPSQTATSVQNTSSANSTSTANQKDFDNFMGDLNSDFTEIETEASVDIDKLTENLPKIDLAPEENPSEEQTVAYNYDHQLCSSLTNEYSVILNEIDNFNTENSESLQGKLSAFFEKKETALTDNKLSPECLDNLQQVIDNWTDKKNQEIEQNINEINALMGAQSPFTSPTSTYSNTPVFAPATMTTTYKKNTTSSSSGTKFETGATQSNPNPKLKYTK